MGVLNQISVGDIMYYQVDDIPTHSAPKGSVSILNTDGYENAYDGLTNEVITLWKSETGRDVPIFQISPITSAEMGANVRKLGEGVVTMAINNPVALQPQINARFLEIDTKRWLKNQILAL